MRTNLRTSNTLGNVYLTNDTLVTEAQTSCGSGIPIGTAVKFGLPHSVVVYLNSNNGYSPDVSGLFHSANDVLGGVNASVTPPDVQAAVARINEAFDGCRILIGTLPFSSSSWLTNNFTTKNAPEKRSLVVSAFPNPYEKQFNLKIISPVSGLATIEFYLSNGIKIHSQSKFLEANVASIVQYTGPVRHGALIYKLEIGKYRASGIVIGTN